MEKYFQSESGKHKESDNIEYPAGTSKLSKKNSK
jgi:hypothetical protein